MSVRTPEELSDRIAADLIWRKKELTALADLFKRAEKGRKSALLRSFIALLYAHWEGFIRSSSQSYLEFLSVRRLPYSALASNFIALCIRKDLKEAASQGDLSAAIDLLLRSGMGTRSRIPYRDGIDTRSNLSSAVLKEILVVLGLNYEPFETKGKLIDERLLATRNHIAHGEYLVIDEDAALELAAEIRGMMEEFRNLVENAVATRRYQQVAEPAGLFRESRGPNGGA